MPSRVVVPGGCGRQRGRVRFHQVASGFEGRRGSGSVALAECCRFRRMRIGNPGSAGDPVVAGRRKPRGRQGKGHLGAGNHGRDGRACRLIADRSLRSGFGAQACLAVGASRRGMPSSARHRDRISRSHGVQRRAQQHRQDRQKTAKAAENRHAATMRVADQNASMAPCRHRRRSFVSTVQRGPIPTGYVAAMNSRSDRAASDCQSAAPGT